VGEVTRIAREAEGFRSVTVNRQVANIGLSESVTSGVSRVLELSNTVIVVEDDIVVSRSFLDYMNSSLSLYANDSSVASIHGYVYPTIHELPTTFFIAGADCWGWATWRRAWCEYRPNGSELLQELLERDLVDQFDFGGRAGYLAMLRDQIAGRNDSWAVRWYASTLLAGKLTLYPGRSLAANIGSDGTGSHGGISSAFDVEVSDAPVAAIRIPVVDSVRGRAAFAEFFASANSRRKPSGILGRIKRALRPIWTLLPPDIRYRVARAFRRFV
jgi:hypothetical protein